MIDSLRDGPGLLPFKLGPTKVVSHYHSFLNYINLDVIFSQIKLVKLQLFELRPQLNNKTSSLYEPHIEYLDAKLRRISDQLQTFEPNRKKRGIIDGLGTVIKSISGNLDYTDAIKYSNAIRVLKNNEHKLESEIKNHISLNKEWVLENSKVLNNITINQDKITKILNLIMNSDTSRETDLIKYAHMAQHLIILGDNIDKLSEEIFRLENTLAFIRISGTPHSTLNIADLKMFLDKLRILYAKDEILDVEIRYFYDIIKLGYFYIDSQIVIVFKVPIAYPITYDLFKLSIVPNKNHQILIPTLPFIAISGKDSMYMETECPKVKQWYLCERKSNYQVHEDPDCIHQLIIKQELNPSCKLTSIILTREAMEQLDDKHYTVSFPNQTKVKISCGQEQYRILQGSYLAAIPFNCYLKTPEFTISNSNDRIKGHPLKIMDIPAHEERLLSKNSSVILNSIDLRHLHDVNEKISLQTPTRLEEIADDSLYHTTIPVYIILLSAVALAIGLTYRHFQAKRIQGNPIEEAIAPTPTGIYSEITDKGKRHPYEIHVDHSNISATLSKNVSK